MSVDVAAAQREKQSSASSPESWLSCASESEQQRIKELLSALETLEPSTQTHEPSEAIARNLGEAAALLGVNQRTIQKWATEPGFPGRAAKAGANNGHYPIEEIKRWRGATTKSTGQRPDIASELRLRKLAVETARREVELEQRLGRLISLDDVESTLATALSTARSLIEEIPDVIASAIPQTKPKLRRMVARLARKKVRGVLAVLADAMRESIEEDNDSDSRDEGRADPQRGEPKGATKTTRAHGRRVGRGRKAKAG